jgi:uncharacterized protein (TIGR02001 family)
MKKILLALFALASISTAQAQLSGNLGLTSDYRFRGISQTQNNAAVQGGIDYAHSSGLYIGNWNSSVSSQQYPNGSGVEADLYAGFKKDIYKGFTIDVGSYNYFYPGANNGANPNFDTQEIYAGVGFGPVSAKYSYSLSNYFGTTNSIGSNYSEANLNQPVIIIKNLNLVAHYGHTSVANNSAFSYNDINVGATYTLPKDYTVAVKWYTNTATSSTFQAANTSNGRQLYKDAYVVSLTKTFD